jgi:hypothetical protein
LGNRKKYRTCCGCREHEEGREVCFFEKEEKKKEIGRKKRRNVNIVSSSQNYYSRPLLNERQIQRRKKECF